MSDAASEEALVEEGRERIEVGVADLFGGLERERAAKDGKPCEELLLIAVEEVVAPRDRRAEGRVPVIGVARALQDVQPFAETTDELAGS